MLSLSFNHIAYICVVTVFAYSLRGATGFGAAAAMPLMGLVVPIKVLVPAWTVLSLGGAATILGRDRRNIAWTDLMGLVPSCMLGIALGLFFFVALESPALAQVLGIVTLLHGALSLWASTRPAAATVSPHRTPAAPAPGPRSSLWRDGRLAGLLGGTVGTTFGVLSSLFFAMYFEAIGMPKDNFRATMSMAVVAIALVRGLGYLAVGAYSRDVLLILAITLPMTLIGIFIGERVQTGLSELTFRRLVDGTMIASGFTLLVAP